MKTERGKLRHENLREEKFRHENLRGEKFRHDCLRDSEKHRIILYLNKLWRTSKLSNFVCTGGFCSTPAKSSSVRVVHSQRDLPIEPLHKCVQACAVFDRCSHWWPSIEEQEQCFSLLTHSLNVQLKQRRRNDAVITSTCVCSTKEMTKSLTDEKQGHPGKCHLRSWGQRKAKQLCHCQQKYLWSHRHQLIYTFWLLRTHSQSDKTHPQSCKQRREFEESRVRLHLLDSSQSHCLQVSFPPSLQTSKQRATSPHAGMRTKRIRFRQNQHKLKFHWVFP